MGHNVSQIGFGINEVLIEYDTDIPNLDTVELMPWHRMNRYSKISIYIQTDRELSLRLHRKTLLGVGEFVEHIIIPIGSNNLDYITDCANLKIQIYNGSGNVAEGNLWGVGHPH